MQSLRSNTSIMIALAIVFGGGAVFLAKTWLNNQASLNTAAPAAEALNLSTLVVAATPLRFGTELDAASLREIKWPSDSLPDGAYTKIEDLLAKGKRIALTPIETNEPVLQSKITGEGQRAGLASLVTEGQRAVTIRVNDINGVAGFVLPGDRVDILMSQNDGGANSAADVVLQNVRVLAIDQLADEKETKPTIAKGVTVETNMQGAQKLSLASLVGTLSLTLRRAGETAALATKRVTISDITRGDTPVDASKAFAASAPQSGDLTVHVTSGTDKKEYTVPRE